MKVPPAIVSRETEARLDDFLALLLRWNARINLVAERDAEKLRARHIADSLQLLPLLPPGDAVAADLGTGGGFPGLVLAIADIGRPWHLVESDRRKAAFLLAASAELGLTHVSVHAARIEAVELPPLGLVTARALAPLTILLGHAARLLAPDGIAVFPKGRTAEAELATAQADWTMQTERFESRTEPGATILRVTGIRRAGL
ncbi:16S rRNA (guanine(527)-N(7))-methyltransferase RsmG [Roseomonas xinghualingensis]|uniref:16S rRNA (guanine(527)-N(7))-methyltransferase RsmG n=1 Tax=Roseomonas xinghualingensis TaxID=2986475 RepID=UPI0021F19EBF|nr:16S rRNA (guanine(527)-N(7))-methyltransferase RsmG [Roseomonas sp. SXEYE001]MCV4206048.1 16S rRNA (guanine(527)-N(7))-methyltransferase RsmG [Roseomonas sp. SXEYE001]